MMTSSRWSLRRKGERMLLQADGMRWEDGTIDGVGAANILE